MVLVFIARLTVLLSIADSWSSWPCQPKLSLKSAEAEEEHHRNMPCLVTTMSPHATPAV